MGRKENPLISSEDRAPRDHKLTQEGALTILLLKPRIPQNTGSIARMCAATGSRLDIVAPLFEINDAKLKRAGLDYWPLLDVRIFPSYNDWQLAQPEKTPWFLEVGGPQIYTEVAFQRSDILAFGDEQEGIDPMLLAKHSERHLRIPQQGVRSMNLATTVGIVTFEALRQIGWLGLR